MRQQAWSVQQRAVVGVVFVILVAVVAVGTSAQPAPPESGVASPAAATPIVFPPTEPVFGATYSEWSARYWQWLVSLPIGVNPAHDASGGACGYGQAGPVFFVPPNLPPCVVPAEMAAMVHVAGTMCSTLEDVFRDATESELRACATEEADRYANISVLIDGEPVQDLASYRVSSPAFPVLMPSPNVHGVDGGIGVAAAAGYWVILPPMAPGAHQVVIQLELADGLVLPEETLRITVIDQDVSPSGATPVP